VNVREIATRLNQWSTAMVARFESIRRAYADHKLVGPASARLTIDLHKVELFIDNGGIWISGSTMGGQRLGLSQFFTDPTCPVDLLPKVREAILKYFDDLETQLQDSVRQRKEGLENLKKAMGPILKDFETDLASDAIQKGKIYPPEE